MTGSRPCSSAPWRMSAARPAQNGADWLVPPPNDRQGGAEPSPQSLAACQVRRRSTQGRRDHQQPAVGVARPGDVRGEAHRGAGVESQLALPVGHREEATGTAAGGLAGHRTGPRRLAVVGAVLLAPLVGPPDRDDERVRARVPDREQVVERLRGRADAAVDALVTGDGEDA